LLGWKPDAAANGFLTSKSQNGISGRKGGDMANPIEKSDNGRG